MKLSFPICCWRFLSEIHCIIIIIIIIIIIVVVVVVAAAANFFDQ